MKIIVVLILVCFFSITLYCCSFDNSKNNQIVARINDYELTLAKFHRTLTTELEVEKQFKLTNETKRDFMEKLIRKELLIQEGKKLGLDRTKEFAESITRYWESTLIRTLMEMKSREIKDKSFISEEEINIRYAEMEQSIENIPPVEVLYDDIKQILLDEKMTEELKRWIDVLRKNATVEIDEELYSQN